MADFREDDIVFVPVIPGEVGILSLCHPEFTPLSERSGDWKYFWGDSESSYLVPESIPLLFGKK